MDEYSLANGILNLPHRLFLPTMFLVSHLNRIYGEKKPMCTNCKITRITIPVSFLSLVTGPLGTRLLTTNSTWFDQLSDLVAFSRLSLFYLAHLHCTPGEVYSRATFGQSIVFFYARVSSVVPMASAFRKTKDAVKKKFGKERGKLVFLTNLNKIHHFSIWFLLHDHTRSIWTIGICI